MLNNYISIHRDSSLNAFKRIEQSVDNTIDSIESYVESVYSNEKLLNDFLFYFGNNPEKYFTKRLLNSKQDEYQTSFIKDCKNYVNRNNNIILQISFFSYRNVNLIKFNKDGSTDFKFSIDPIQVNYSNQTIPYTFMYTKELPSPSDLTSRMGKIQFSIDIKKLFPVIKNYNVNNAYAIKGDELLTITSSSSNKVSSDDIAIYKCSFGQGTIKKSLFNKIYYNVCNSQKYDFKIITIIDTNTIIKENITTFLILLCSIVLLFSVMAAIIAIRMNYDAKYIKQIISFIDNVKLFDFSQKKIQRRNDEYSMIANSLNDMSDKINKHIEQEYLLKLDQQKAEMMALENQINPHFLYNTLEIIRSKSFLNGDHVVSDAIYNLGSMYRDIVKSDLIITVDAELEMLTKYLKLMEFKYEDNFYYQINVCQQIRELNTLKFWMQPIVENFFKHGFNKDNQYNLILIIGEEREQSYIIEFVDNGSCINTQTLIKLNSSFCVDADIIETQSIGITNIYKRLRYYYGDKMSMHISNNKEAGITVKVEIEKEK